MGFENMRMNSGRCPPFLVAGLILMCILLTCNWWTLSSQNYDLIKELEDLGDHLRLCSQDRDVCLNTRSELETKFRENENAAGAMEVKLSQQSENLQKVIDEKIDKVTELETQSEKLSNSLKTCNTELENIKKLDESRAGVLALLRMEKDNTAAEIMKGKEKIKELTNQIEQLKLEKKTTTVSQASPPIVTKVTQETKPQVEEDEGEKITDTNNEINDGGDLEEDKNEDGQNERKRFNGTEKNEFEYQFK